MELQVSAVLLLLVAASAAAVQPLLRTPTGLARGVTSVVRGDGGAEVRVKLFRGVRYASAPAGLAGRWRPPVPLNATAAGGGRTYDATAAGPVCPGFSAGAGTDENCLNMDIYLPPGTPSAPSSAAPPVAAMVYFHGGDLTGGAAGDSDFGLLAAGGAGQPGVAVFSVNYRLAALGFLNLGGHGGGGGDEEEEGQTAAFGFLDMLEALRYVQVSRRCRCRRCCRRRRRRRRCCRLLLLLAAAADAPLTICPRRAASPRSSATARRWASTRRGSLSSARAAVARRC